MDWLDELLGQQDKQEFPELSPMAMQDDVMMNQTKDIPMSTNGKAPVSPMDLVPKFENKMDQAVAPKDPMQELSGRSPQSEMNPMVKDYLMNKAAPGKYSSENREALASESGEANPWALGLAGLGGALQDYGTGGKGSAMQNVMNLQKMAKDRKEGKLKEFDIMAEKEKTAKYDDPNSMESKQAQEIAVKFGISPDKVGSMSANRISELIPSMSKLMDIDIQNKNRQESAAQRKYESDVRMNQRSEDLAEKKRLQELDLKNIPAQDRETVLGLTKKNVDKETIANSIDSVMNKWDNLSEGEKLKQGQQLIKVLNSTQGADAVGTEEAKRLANKLEFAMGNLTNNNPIQFGRDLEGFKKDAKITSSNIRDSIKMNQNIIDQKLGKPVEASKPKSIAKKQYSKSRDMTRIVYDDGSIEEIQGRQ